VHELVLAWLIRTGPHVIGIAGSTSPARAVSSLRAATTALPDDVVARLEEIAAAAP
jgi:aryl-alcohol dehydrogenase-like predicted oxidoreductase